MATKKSTPKGKGKVRKVMHEYKSGELKSGSGKKVTKRKQAVAIALNEQRAAEKKSGAKKSMGKKTAAKKSTAKKSSAKKSTSKRSAKKSK